MAPGDERLLVGRGNGRTRPEGGQHRPQAHHATGSDDEEVDVRPASQVLDGGSTDLDRCLRWHVAQVADDGVLGHDRDRRPQGPDLVPEQHHVPTRAQPDDLEARVAPQDVQGLSADGAGRSEQNDAHSRIWRQAHAIPAAISGKPRGHRAGRRGRRKGTNPVDPARHRGPVSPDRSPWRLRHA